MIDVLTCAVDAAIACCRSVVNVAIPQRRGSELPMNASRLNWVTLAPPSSRLDLPLLGDCRGLARTGGSKIPRSFDQDSVTRLDQALVPNRPTDPSDRPIQPLEAHDPLPRRPPRRRTRSSVRCGHVPR